MQKWVVFQFLDNLLPFSFNICQSNFYYRFYFKCQTGLLSCLACIYSMLYSYFLQYSSTFFLVCNVARFVSSRYLDKKSIVFFAPLCPVKLIGQTWYLLSVTIVNVSFLLTPPPPFFFLLFFLQCPQPLRFRGALYRRVKRLPGRSVSRMISCMHIWTNLIFSK